MSPRRALFVDYYSFVGGGQQNLLSVFSALDRRRWAPMLALPKEGAFAAAARALGVPVFIAPMGKARWRLPWQAYPAMRRLRKLMREPAGNGLASPDMPVYIGRSALANPGAPVWLPLTKLAALGAAGMGPLQP